MIERDVICVLCCTAFAVVADHHPKTRKQLIEEGLNPNDPNAGRGLCLGCHNRWTAQSSPGGWNNRT